MPVAYRSSSASGSSDSQGTSKATNVPAGAAAGDIALLAIEMWWDSGTDPTVTWPAGFTQIVNITLTGSGPARLKVAWKRLTAADTGSYTMSWTGTQWNMAHCILLSGGLASGDPVDVGPNTATSASGTTVPTTTVVTTAADFLVHFVSNENTATKTPATGFTEVQDGDYLETSYWIPGSSGSKSAAGATLSTSTLNLSALIAIKPDAGGGAIDLVPAAVAQTQTSDSPALTQAHSLVVAGVTQAQAADSIGLTQVHVLTVAAATQAQSSDAPSLTVILPVQDATQAQAADNVSLTQVHSLAVADSAQAQAADSPALAQAHSLAADDVTQAQASTTVGLTQVHVLSIQSADQAQTADNVSLTAGGSLVVADSTQAQSAQSLALTQVHIIITADALQSQQVGQVALAQVHILQVAGASQAQTSSNLDLVAVGAYTPPDSVTVSARSYASTATARDQEPSATARASDSTATPRSPA